MTLMRAFAKVDTDGKVTIPSSIRREAGLKPGQLVELKVVGTGKKQILVTARESAR